jgi:hypothetical protein
MGNYLNSYSEDAYFEPRQGHMIPFQWLSSAPHKYRDKPVSFPTHSNSLFISILLFDGTESEMATAAYDSIARPVWRRASGSTAGVRFPAGQYFPLIHSVELWLVEPPIERV